MKYLFRFQFLPFLLFAVSCATTTVSKDVEVAFSSAPAVAGSYRMSPVSSEVTRSKFSFLFLTLSNSLDEDSSKKQRVRVVSGTGSLSEEENLAVARAIQKVPGATAVAQPIFQEDCSFLNLLIIRTETCKIKLNAYAGIFESGR